MISIFGNEPGSPTHQPAQHPAQQASNQLHVVPPQSQTSPQAAQHPAVSRTVVTPSASSSTALSPRFADTHTAAPAPEKHGIFSWLSIGKTKKRLQMLETVSLGEKRFVALVQVDGRQFLIGGAPSNVGMLAELAPEETFHQVLRDATEGLNETPANLPALPAPVPVAVSYLAEAPAPAPAVSAAPVIAPAVSDAPVIASPVSASPLLAEPAFRAPAPPPEPVAPHAPVSYASIAPLPLAEAIPAPTAVSHPAPKPAAPSLPPHVAARLAELQAEAQIEQAKLAHSVLPDDLSLEEPVSFSPSLLAAMQQRARAALLDDQAPAAQMNAQTAPIQAAAQAPAPSFTFQFSPMLTSTTQAVRLPGSAMKLQGAA